MSLLAIIFVFLTSLIAACLPADTTNGTELILAFLTHRHGDRTPVAKSAKYLKDSNAIEALIAPYGYGQLTDKGIESGYELGKVLRRRYNDLFGSKYNSSKVYLMSTDSQRTKMTCLAVMAAVYPPNERAWNPRLNWSPVPYSTVPVKYDYNLAFLNCPTFTNSYNTKLNTQPKVMEQYANLFERLALAGYDIKSRPVKAYSMYDAFVAAESLGYKLEPEIKELMNELKQAAGTAFDILYGDESTLDLQAGVLLKKFFDVANAVINRTESRRLWIYSAHDFNVYSLFSSSRAVPRPGAPKYSSYFSLELRKVTATGQYIVVPVFVSSPGETETYPMIDGCNVPCDFEQYRNLLKPYLLNESEYRRKCSFDEDADINTSSID